MGGLPCRTKEILDQFAAAERAFTCMKNTALIVASTSYGQVPISKELAAAFQQSAEGLAGVCSKIEAELSPYLPPSNP